jgi:di/tricarboxylate transporter
MFKGLKVLGFIGGIAIAVLVCLLPLDGISPEGQHCLGLSLLAVIWWATGVTHPGYTSALLLGLYVLLNVAPGNVVFGLWTTPIIYLVVGGYLIAAAVRDSGLGKRIAYHYIVRYISSYRSIIVGAYLLGFMLSFLIPHPWPRSFLIMSVMAMIIKGADIPAADAANIGLAVFAASCPTSAILLTGDSVINTIAVGMSGIQLSWLGWLWQMGIPAIVASILTLFLQLVLYKPSKEVVINKAEFQGYLTEMGPLNSVERKTLIWVVLGVVLWATDSIHHIHPGWVALLVSMGMSLPIIGGVIGPKHWNDVPIATLFFLTAALAIGKVGAYTGMNAWVAGVILPGQLPTNPFMLAALISVVGVAVHMVLGSVLAVMGVIIPTFMVLASSQGVNPLFISLMVYMVLAMHYVLPFHHMNMLVGLGKDQGGYTDRQVIRLGLPLTVATLVITIGVMVPWWMITGLVK